MTKIKITDNFLGKNEFKTIQDFISSPYFAWFFNPYVTFKEEQHLENNFQFTHRFFVNHEMSNQYNLILPLIEKINPLGLVRVKANLGTRTEKHIEHGLHADYDTPNLTTGIFYINTNNGYTKFVDGQTVESVANRYVEFNSQQLHTGISQTDTKERIAINLNYLSYPND